MVAIREEVRVDRSPADAFRLFTAGIGQWWPLEEGYSFGRGRASEIHLEATPGGRLYERFADGDELLIGRVLECDPPHRIVFTWKGPDWPGETEVEVSFVAEGGRTRVTSSIVASNASATRPTGGTVNSPAAGRASWGSLRSTVAAPRRPYDLGHNRLMGLRRASAKVRLGRPDATVR